MNLTIANDPIDLVFGEEEAYRLIKEAGFDGIDLQTMHKRDLLNGHIEAAHHTKHLLEEIGLICNLAHAPFRNCRYGMAFDLSEPAFREIVNALEYASIVGVKYVVVHGILTPEEARTYSSLQYNYQFFKALAPFADQFGVCIALENVGEGVPNPLVVHELLRMLDDPCFVTLVDTGHARLCYVRPQDFIRDLPRGSLRGLHIQDNRGEKDDHLLPGMGILNWDKILKALAEVGYEGDFNLEVHGFFKCFEAENLPAALKLAESVGRSCIRKLEQYRSELNA